jgi:hypothetical protein
MSRLPYRIAAEAGGVANPAGFRAAAVAFLIYALRVHRAPRELAHRGGDRPGTLPRERRGRVVDDDALGKQRGEVASAFRHGRHGGELVRVGGGGPSILLPGEKKKVRLRPLYRCGRTTGPPPPTLRTGGPGRPPC